MPLIDATLYVSGQAVPPYVGDWVLISSKRYPDAESSWEDAQLISAEAKTGEELTLDDALGIEQLIREQVAEEGGAPLESRIFSRVERTAAGESLITYKVEHAAHGSPIVWAPIIVFIAANWKAILIGLGLAAAAAAIIAFTIKSVGIVWKAGGKIEDLVEEMPPALVGLGAGLLIIVALFALGGRKNRRQHNDHAEFT
ncbi:unnamed protein product [marine sediment metagenome]|uniref:Uncharacterized protein n=1 Tax=marine sediment metagenome TaxID=412755 RepID=X1RLK1_9ZZZZ